MGRLRGFLWLLAGLVIAAAAALVAFLTLSRATVQQAPLAQQEPVITVPVASRTITVRTLLTRDDLELQEFPVSAVPESAVRDLERAVGKITAVDLYPGEMLFTQRLIDPTVIAGDGRTALLLAEDQILMAFPAADLMSRIGILKPGDQVDLLFSFEFPLEDGVASLASGDQIVGEEGGATGPRQQVTFNLLQNVTIAAVVGGTRDEEGELTDRPEAILFNIDPQDALVLKFVQDAGGTVDVVLRAPNAEGLFAADPVDIEYVMNYYLIPTD
ncbi:MAG: Flp pilus assembly protein CpaB [Anaerolineae bacterium]|nr:Flp pilus assembly protein CpaB [Anaerolineae bacterium]